MEAPTITNQEQEDFSDQILKLKKLAEVSLAAPLKATLVAPYLAVILMLAMQAAAASSTTNPIKLALFLGRHKQIPVVPKTTLAIRSAEIKV